MRNLKRALSLGLTATMISGLMVMGSSAASYADVTSEQNQEAIEVLKEVGIMTGDEKGNFNPEAKVTRNEMAVVMSNLMAYNVKTYANTSPFTDVPDWAEPYVAACYTNGITSGYDAKYLRRQRFRHHRSGRPDGHEGSGLLPVSVRLRR